ncbi:hypothetical protein AYK25_09675 [Thermoplasmatales archaeon SM1-50]|nr:MAG: hypothetical protein AYK25_09675 [Thermoplasmatales archaeon SM1-50]
MFLKEGLLQITKRKTIRTMRKKKKNKNISLLIRGVVFLIGVCIVVFFSIKGRESYYVSDFDMLIFYLSLVILGVGIPIIAVRADNISQLIRGVVFLIGVCIVVNFSYLVRKSYYDSDFNTLIFCLSLVVLGVGILIIAVRADV